MLGCEGVVEIEICLQYNDILTHMQMFLHQDLNHQPLDNKTNALAVSHADTVVV